MNRIYEYECLSCGLFFETIRDMEDVYSPIECPGCKHVSDGKKAKRILSPAQIRHVGGPVKGRMNSYGR
jgi:putative FmdB family regulatory protein